MPPHDLGHQLLSSPPSFTLPYHAKMLAQAYAEAPSPVINRNRRLFNQGVERFLDLEANEGKESSAYTSASSHSDSSSD